MLNHNCQWHLSDKNESSSTIYQGRKTDYNLMRSNNGAQMLQPPGLRNTQQHTRHISSWWKPFQYHTWNNFQSSQYSSQKPNLSNDTKQQTCSSPYDIRATSASTDHQDFHGRRSFWLNCSLNSKLPGKYHSNYSHKPNITWNGPGASHLEQVRYMVNNANLLTTVMVDQTIIQAAISSVETFDRNKKKLKSG